MLLLKHLLLLNFPGMKTKSILFGLVFVICISISNVSSAQATNVQDSLALVDLYNSTNGPGWLRNDNWLAGPVNTWYGVSVFESSVEGLNLRSNQLTGTIPSSIGNLTTLYDLDLSYNQLSGNIPPELGIGYLEDLYLNNNQLSGSIPASIPAFYMNHLNLSNNQLSGSIPPEFGDMHGAYTVFIYLNNNQLSGSIPPELGNIENLRELDLSNNKLSGIIPPELGSLYYGDPKLLWNLLLNNNQLSGSIPPELGTFENLRKLDVSNNKLSGPIPSELANFSLLNELDLSHNRFTYDGMELIAQTFPFARYDHQKRISLNLNNNVLSVSAGGTLGNNTYHWYGVRKNGHARAVITGDSVFHPTKSGIYYVRVFNAVADNLTLRTDTFYYRVPSVNTISVNELQANDGKSSFIVYPNPAKDIVHIQTNGNASFSLVNQAGKVLLTKNINGSGIMNVKSIAAGLYYLKNNTTGYTRKIIKIQ